MIITIAYIYIYTYVIEREREYIFSIYDRLCGLVIRVSGNRSGGPSSISGTTRISEK
jgi:hypothetical protein